jgi:glycolate oxidase iron-sulfur subunit
MLKIDYEHYFHDQPEWMARAVALRDKIFMATEWLQHHTHLEQLLASKKKETKIVTYHDPCHAKKMQGVHMEPRNLISKNYKIVEMSDPNTCCGFGGVTMQSEKYHFAKAAGIPKADMINKTKADVVSAECSACRMQINSSLGYTQSNVVFKNPIELIAQALRD